MTIRIDPVVLPMEENSEAQQVMVSLEYSYVFSVQIHVYWNHSHPDPRLRQVNEWLRLNVGSDTRSMTEGDHEATVAQ